MLHPATLTSTRDLAAMVAATEIILRPDATDT
jgi:hypothetical protein